MNSDLSTSDGQEQPPEFGASIRLPPCCPDCVTREVDSTIEQLLTDRRQDFASCREHLADLKSQIEDACAIMETDQFETLCMKWNLACFFVAHRFPDLDYEGYAAITTPAGLEALAEYQKEKHYEGSDEAVRLVADYVRVSETHDAGPIKWFLRQGIASFERMGIGRNIAAMYFGNVCKRLTEEECFREAVAWASALAEVCDRPKPGSMEVERVVAPLVAAWPTEQDSYHERIPFYSDEDAKILAGCLGGLAGALERQAQDAEGKLKKDALERAIGFRARAIAICGEGGMAAFNYSGIGKDLKFLGNETGETFYHYRAHLWAGSALECVPETNNSYPTYLNNLALICRKERRFDEAEQLFTKARDLAKSRVAFYKDILGSGTEWLLENEKDDLSAFILASRNLADVHSILLDATSARSLIEGTLACMSDLEGDRFDYHRAGLLMSRTNVERTQPDLCLRTLEEARRLLQTVARKIESGEASHLGKVSLKHVENELAKCLHQTAKVQRRKSLQTGNRLLVRAQSLYVKHRNRRAYIDCEITRGDFAVHGHAKKAHYQKALGLAQDINYQEGLAKAYDRLSSFALSGKEPDFLTALDLRMQALLHDSHWPHGQARSTKNLAETLVKLYHSIRTERIVFGVGSLVQLQEEIAVAIPSSARIGFPSRNQLEKGHIAGLLDFAADLISIARMLDQGEETNLQCMSVEADIEFENGHMEAAIQLAGEGAQLRAEMSDKNGELYLYQKIRRMRTTASESDDAHAVPLLRLLVSKIIPLWDTQREGFESEEEQIRHAGSSLNPYDQAIGICCKLGAGHPERYVCVGWNLLQHRKAAILRTVMAAPSEAEPSKPSLADTHLPAIPGHTTLIEYAACGNELHAFVIKDNADRQRFIACHPLRCDRKKILQLIGSYHKDIERVEALLDENRQLPVGLQPHFAASALLYEKLLAPIMSDATKPIEGRDVRRLCIAPTGRLHVIPFAELLNQRDGHHLGQDFEVVQVPSETVRKTMSYGRSAAPGIRFVGLYDPDIPNAELVLKETSRTIPRDQKKILNVRYMGKDKVFTAMEQATVVFVMCHGKYNPQTPMDSFLKLSDSSAIRAADFYERSSGSLSHVLLLNLCACDVLRHETLRGDEIMGFVRALLKTGAGCIIGTLWKPDPVTAQEFLKTFVEYWLLPPTTACPGGSTRMSKAAAFKKAIHQLRRQRETAHPYFWGNFVLYGDGD